MTTTNFQDSYIEYKNAPVELMASAVKTSSGSATAVQVKKGKYRVVVTVTANTWASGFDTAIIIIQRNTVAATSTWKDLMYVPLGDVLGLDFANDVDVYDCIVDNQGDYQLRVTYYLNGSAASVTFSVAAYPIVD